MNQEMRNYKAEKELMGGICISEVKELQEKAEKYDKLKEAVGEDKGGHFIKC